MSQRTKKSAREIAEEAVARWQAAVAGDKQATAAWLAFNEENKALLQCDSKFETARERFGRQEATIKQLELKVLVVEASGRKHDAEHEATLALDAAERNEGDELALACDLAALRDALIADDEEAARLTSAIAEVAQRRAARPAAAKSAWANLAARRTAAKQPPPQRIPEVPFSPSFSAPWDIVRLLAEAIEAGPPVSDTPQRVLGLRNEVSEIRAAREVERREAEERDAEAAFRKEEREAARRLADEKDRAAWQAKLAAEQNERDALAAADLKREAQGAA